MTAAQTIQVRLSECRQRLNELLQVETRSEDETTELERLTSEVSVKEPELRAALAAAPDPQEVVTATGDPETRERLEIRSKTGLADFLSAAAAGREVVGAAREYADAVGCAPLNRVPLDIFTDGQPEVRAISVGPAVDVLLNLPFRSCSSAAPPHRSESRCRRMGPGRSRFLGSQPRLRLTRWRRMLRHLLLRQ